MLCRLKALDVWTKICGYNAKSFSISTADYNTPNVSLGKAKKGKTAAVLEKKVLPVEKDTKKLVKYACGSNILKEGSDTELKPDSEYPDWLWTLHIGKPKTLAELDPNSMIYWKKVKKQGMRDKNKLSSIRKY